MQHRIFIIFFTLATIFSQSTHAMKTPILDTSWCAHYPIQAPQHQQLITARAHFQTFTVNDSNRVTRTFPEIQLVQNMQHPHDRGVCYEEAVKYLCKLTPEQLSQLPRVGNDDWITIFQIIPRYCIPICKNDAQPGDLVVYAQRTTNPDLFIIKHFANYNSANSIRSKFGSIPGIFNHPFWLVPEGYDNTAFIFTLSEKFKNHDGNNNIIFNALHKTSCSRIDLYELRNEIQEAFCAAAAQKIQPIFKQTDALLNDNPRDMLKRYMSIDINKKNKNGESPLKIAAGCGNTKVVILLMQYQAEYDPTALTAATQNKHTTIVRLLQIYRSL